MDFSLEKKFINSSTNHLMVLLRKYPKRQWNWIEVSYNPNLSWDFIKKNHKNFFSYSGFSQNPNVTLEIIKNNPEFPWDWKSVVMNPNITFDTILEHGWNLENISRNPNVTWTDIINHPEINWYWEHLSSNENITIQNIKDTINKFPWSWIAISQNKIVTWETVKSNPELPWRWFTLIQNVNISWEIIKNDSRFCGPIQRNRSISWKDILLYYETREHECGPKLEQHSTVTIDDIYKNPNIFDTTYTGISYNPNVKWQDVQRSEEKLFSCLSVSTSYGRERIVFNFNILSGNRFLYDNTVRKRRMEKATKNRRRFTNLEFVNWY